MSDDSKILYLQKQMNKSAQELAAMSSDLAAARQVKEFSADRRKRILAIATKVFLDEGETAAAADTKARASDNYGEHLIKQETEFRCALEVIEKYEGLKVIFASAQSLLATEREKLARI